MVKLNFYQLKHDVFFYFRDKTFESFGWHPLDTISSECREGDMVIRGISWLVPLFFVVEYAVCTSNWLRESAPGELDKQVPREAAEVGLRRRERGHTNRERAHGREKIRVVSSERDKMLNFIIVVVISFAAERFFLLAAVALRFFLFRFYFFSVYHSFFVYDHCVCAVCCAPHKHNQYAMMWISRLFAPVESARRHRRDQSTHSTRLDPKTEQSWTERNKATQLETYSSKGSRRRSEVKCI